MWKQTFNDYPNNFTSACNSTIAASTQRSEILKNIKGLTRKNNLTGLSRIRTPASLAICNEMSPAGRRQFYEKHIKNMTLTIDENGNVSVELKRG